MSLFRQLWLAVILVTLTSFIGSFAVSMLSTRSYLEQQLHRKNIDSANSLALSISQLSKDPVTIGLQIAALFDSGQYESISITSPDGKVVAERVQDRLDTSVPKWFIDLFPIHAEAGRAQITDNWMQFGVIKVVSHASLAHQALWDQIESLLIWFLVAGILSGLIGMIMLSGIRRPLAAMVSQAEAITERRFLTISEPRIPELRTIARATNDMVRRLHNRVIEETSRLAILNKQTNYDSVTGLANRAHLMNLLGEVEGKDVALTSVQNGSLLLVRLNDLEKINQKLGRTETNRLLFQAGALMNRIAGETSALEVSDLDPSDPLAARLNGSDFVLIIPDSDDASQVAERLTVALTALLAQIGGEVSDFCHIGAIHYERGAKLGKLLANADAALATAEGRGSNAWHAVTPQPDDPPTPANIGDWRHIFSDALNEDRFELDFHPVVSPAGEQLHQEAVVRMQAQRNGGWLDARDFVAIAARLDLTGPLDLTVVRHALESLKLASGELAVNLSVETIVGWESRNKLVDLLHQNPDLRHRLWFEVPEYGASRKFEAFHDFCHTFKKLGCRIGVNHFGRHFTELQKFTDLGLDYVKVDAGFVHGVNQNKENQKFLKGLANLAHRIGIIVIASGVQTEAEQKTLTKLGLDGVIGPGVK
ncbi:MAG: EAL domain-containing protein [Nitrosospira sp.]